MAIARCPAVFAATALFLATGACGRSGSDPPPAVTVTLTEGTNMAAAASPAGDAFALTIQGTLWLLPAEGGEAVPLTGWEVEAAHPAWSPDGSRIAFQNFTDHDYQIWTVAPDGSDLRPVTEGPFDHREPHWSPDGRRIAFSSDRSLEGSYDVWTVEVEGGAVRRWTRSRDEAFAPAWSPDGRRIAYVEGSSVRAVDEEGGVEELVVLQAGTPRAPAWTPDGEGIVHQDEERRIVVGGRPVTGSEDVFPFPVSWLPDGRFLYTADGGIRIRDRAGESVEVLPFRAALRLERSPPGRKDHRFDYPAPRPVRGIFAPVLSPDGSRIAFTALNDLWVMEEGASPIRLTEDRHVVWAPSWTPDGQALVFPSDRHGDGRPGLYRIELGTREVTRIPTPPDARITFPTLSPDGRRFAYIEGADQSLRVLDADSGESRFVAAQAYASNVGRPSWSPDGRRVALADMERITRRFREGRNLIRVVDVDTGEWRFHEPGPYPAGLSERFEAGPAWSPDGRWMAFVMQSVLHALPVDPEGAPTGPARRLTDHVADLPSWGPDSQTILHLSAGRLHTVHVDGSGGREIPVDLTWRPVVGEGELLLRAGALWNGVDPFLHRDVEIRIVDGRIVEVRGRGRDESPGARVIEAPELTVLPGLWDAHVHPRVLDFTGPWWAVQLAFGITTVLSNGASTYHTLLARESLAAGSRVGPRLLASPIFDGNRPFYGHHRAVTDEAALELELAQARELEMDYLKAYVRAPASFMRRVADAAREMGVPNGSHFLSPGIRAGMGGTTHLSASQRMGYSWALSAGGRSYQDVLALYSEGAFHLSSHHTRGENLLGEGAPILEDPRFHLLMPPNYRDQVAAQAARPPTEAQRERIREDVATPAAILRAGGLVTIGSDTPLAWPALGLHAQLRAFAHAVSPHEALQAVTVNAARYAYADRDLGTVEPGKIADLILVRGDPLEDVANAGNVELVLQAGIPVTVEELLEPYRGEP
jgi:Tol biopolymer transport system component/imidazolonepropionase-like amidohydrolase